MAQLTAPGLHHVPRHVPMRAVGLGIVIAAAVIAAALLAMQVVSSDERTSVDAAAPAVPAVVGGVPHQVAPLGLDVAAASVYAPAAPIVRGSDGTVPHQAAPLGLDEAAAPAAGEIPHQVAPLEKLGD